MLNGSLTARSRVSKMRLQDVQNVYHALRVQRLTGSLSKQSVLSVRIVRCCPWSGCRGREDRTDRTDRTDECRWVQMSKICRTGVQNEPDACPEWQMLSQSPQASKDSRITKTRLAQGCLPLQREGWRVSKILEARNRKHHVSTGLQCRSGEMEVLEF